VAGRTALVLGDQLSHANPVLEGADRVLLVESHTKLASGRFHRHECRYDPTRRTGDDACPFTALYWDFIARHEQRWAGNPRMALPLRGLQRMDPAELAAVRERAARARAQLAGA